MYQVIKHSAKGTTWGEHKYIRKEGNRYIYPEDVKKSAINANDNYNYRAPKPEVPGQNYVWDNEKEKWVYDNGVSSKDYKFPKKEDGSIDWDAVQKEVDSNLEKQDKNSVKVEIKKSEDTLSKTDPRFANRTDTLSKTDPRFKTSDALSKTDPRFKYTIKRNSDPADRYKVVRDKNDERRELAKRRANISDEVNRELYGNDEKSNKYYKDRRRAESIEAYKDVIKGKDAFNSTNSLNELKRAEELARKRRDMRQRNRYISYYNVGPLRIRQDASVAGRSKTVTGDPDTKIKVVKKKKRR